MEKTKSGYGKSCQPEALLRTSWCRPLRSQHSGRKCRWVLLNLAFRFTPPHFFLGLFVT